MKKKDVYSSHTLLCIRSAKRCPFLSCVGLWGLLTCSPGLTQSQFGSHTPISSSLLHIFICTSPQLPPVLLYTAIPIMFVAQSMRWQLSSSSLVCLHSQSLAWFTQDKKYFPLGIISKILFQQLNAFIITNPSSSACKSSVSRFMTHQGLHGTGETVPGELEQP